MFLNGVRFDLRESVDISFLNTYVNGRFVQWRRSESVWEKILLCSITVAKGSYFLWYNFLFEQINHIRTAVHGHPQLCLKFRLPNRISFEVFWPVHRQSWNEGIWNATQLCQAFGGLAVRTLPGASRLFNPTLRACPRQTDVLLACIDSFFSLFPRFACEGVWSGIFCCPHGSIFRCASVSQALIYLWREVV